MKLLLTVLLAFYLSCQLQAQPTLTYYLPDITYDESIPTPSDVLGYQIGEWHLSHDQLLLYMRALAAASPRITIQEYAKSYEQRALVYLTITSEQNHQQLEQIRQEHLALSNPSIKSNVSTKDQAVVLYQGFSIHGNEASGGNAAPLVAYYLAAGQSEEVERLLDNAVILLDPCFNPDGFQRFSTWVNMHKNDQLISDNNDREYDEAWPGGRTNHYWFDLNRDWLLVQHPESQGRIELFHQWKPNVLTDHHEMGTDNTFFFMPGIPQRTNPITPAKNQELTAKIGEYHAKALDEIGSLYYSQESFDDFYYGKGSTYPDANACIGILFEQASARGHLQDSDNGKLSFPFAIRNQVRTALSTQKGGLALKEELLDFQKAFYENAKKEAAQAKVKAYVFGSSAEATRTAALVELLKRHQIEAYALGKDVTIDGQAFASKGAYIVPTEQNQYKLIRGIFETSTTFKDSVFYDVSSWTLPLAFGLSYEALSTAQFNKSLLGEIVDGLGEIPQPAAPAYSDYAYLIKWNAYYAPRTLYALMKKGLRAKVATKALNLQGQNFPSGTIMIPVQNQSKTPKEIHELILQATAKDFTEVVGVSTGLSPEGIDLGSPNFEVLQRPKVLLVVGEGVSSYDAGEVWHLLDQRLQIPISKVTFPRLSKVKLETYNTIVMVGGSYNGKAEKLKEWVKSGGTLIAMKGAAEWAKGVGLANVSVKNGGKNRGRNKKEQRAYGALSNDRGSKRIGGAIVGLNLDLSHPLCYGYQRTDLAALQRGTLVFNTPTNIYASPVRYEEQPLLSGYIHPENIQKLKRGSAIVVSGIGTGKTLCFSINPNFRAFWYGTNRLFVNSIFFGPIISRNAVESTSGE